MSAAALLAVQLALAAPAADAPDGPAAPNTGSADPMSPQYRLLDVAADVLRPNEKELSLFWGNLAWGLAPRFQVASDLAGLAVGLLNVGARYQLLDEPGLRVSAQLSFAYWALAPLLEGQLASVPLELRASVPLFEQVELNLGARFAWLLVHVSELDFNSMTLGAEATLVRYDRRGAWLLQGKLPLLAGNALRASEVLGIPGAAGSLWFDDSRGWSLLVGRDQRLGARVRLRVGLGYRERPGVVFFESLGNVVVSANVRWRL